MMMRELWGRLVYSENSGARSLAVSAVLLLFLMASSASASCCRQVKLVAALLWWRSDSLHSRLCGGFCTYFACPSVGCMHAAPPDPL